MRMRAILLGAVMVGAGFMLSACGREPDDLLQGYAEADYLYVAPQDAGLISSLAVREGDEVAADAPLFTLNQDRARASFQAAQAQSEASRAGSLTAAIAAAQANALLTQATLQRTQALYERNLYARQRLDQDRAANAAAQAEVRRLIAERASAAREDDAQNAQAALARTQLTDRAVRSPAAGRVERIFRRPGEFAQPGEPVIALLPPANIKLRFFAPEPMLSQLRLGQEVGVSCDGCREGLRARIFFIASEPQFTPPVIYSIEEREKLVFLVEARPLQPERLRPGQPLDIDVSP
ncbi:MAG: HlyD family secretion protein [Hyphomonadaceae bacterium]